MAAFLLIHGASHGAWCWSKVLAALETRGHTAKAIDLPSHGADPTVPDDVTLDDYAHAIVDALHGPTIVLGHSMAGYAITRAAEINPKHFQQLVHLCAFTPWPGKTLSDMRNLGATQPLLPAIRKVPKRPIFTFDPAATPDLFYHDCDATDVALANASLSPQPIAPSEIAITLTDRSQSLPQHYILCDQDRAIPPELQQQMAEKMPLQNRHILHSSHAPFFSCPDMLAGILDTISKA